MVVVAAAKKGVTIGPFEMSSKSSQRRRPKGRQHSHRSASPAAVPARPFNWKLAVGLGVGGLALVVWCGAKFWNDSSKVPVTPVAFAPTANRESPGNPQSSRDAKRSFQIDPAFSARVNHGTELLAEGKPAEAVQVLTEARQMNPEDEDVRYDLGLALTRLGKFEEAIQQYNEALRIMPNYVEAHNNLGNLLMRTGKIDEAIPHFETALAILPDYASAHNNLGTALQRLGRTNDAFFHFKQAVKIKPEYWEAHFNVATSSLSAGLLSDARSELETVLRLQPDFKPAQDALAEVQSRQRASEPVSR
jgi:Flp pilus assembly protein TadD